MRTRHQIIDDLIEATEYHDTEIILNIDHIRDLFNDAIGHLKDASKVVRDNQRLRRHIQQLKSDNAQQARCIENLTDKLNATNDSLPRWISVEEKLPEVEKRYDGYEFSGELLVYDGLRRRTAYYCHTSGVWYDSRYEDDTFDVTHWMPLPEPPKEDK